MPGICVAPEELRRLAGLLQNAAGDLRGIRGRVGGALGGLDWEARRRAGVEGQVSDAQGRAGALASQAEAMARYLSAKAEAFEEADRHSYQGLAGRFLVPPPLEEKQYIGGLVVIVPVVIVGGVTVAVGAFSEWSRKTLVPPRDYCTSDPKIIFQETMEARQKLDQILGRTPAGRDALKAAQAMNVTFKLSTPGMGTWYDSATNTMYVDPTLQEDLAAEAFVHELTHARQHAQGQIPDVRSTTREEYLRGMYRIEADALIKQLEYENERPDLAALTMLGSGDPNVGLIYRTAYAQAYAARTAQNLGSLKISPAEAEEAARQAGRAALIELYENGSLRVSAPPHRSYRDEYGQAWDRAHAL